MDRIYIHINEITLDPALTNSIFFSIFIKPVPGFGTGRQLNTTTTREMDFKNNTAWKNDYNNSIPADLSDPDLIVALRGKELSCIPHTISWDLYHPSCPSQEVPWGS